MSWRSEVRLAMNETTMAKPATSEAAAANGSAVAEEEPE